MILDLELQWVFRRLHVFIIDQRRLFDEYFSIIDHDIVISDDFINLCIHVYKGRSKINDHKFYQGNTDSCLEVETKG